jgi:ribonuclease HI
LANYTAWSQKAKEHVFAMQDVDVHLGIEHHIPEQGIKQARKEWKKQGFRLSAAPAPPTGRSDNGTAGGVWVAASSHLSSFSLWQQQKQVAFRKSDRQWSCHMVRAAGSNILFIAVYLEPGLAAEQGNLDTLADIADTLRTTKCSFVIGGDWNRTPEQLATTGWPHFVGGSIVTAGDDHTCTAGSMRQIDFLVVAAPLSHDVAAELDLASPWSPHLGLKILIRTEACCKQEFNYPHIKPIPQASGPARQPWQFYLVEAEGQLEEKQWNSPFSTECSDMGLTMEYGAFSLAAELLQCDRAGLYGNEKGYTGRGSLPTAVWTKCARPHRPGSYFRCPALTFWSAVQNRLGEASKLKARGRGGQRTGNVCCWLQRAGAAAHHHILPQWEEKHKLVLRSIIDVLSEAVAHPGLRLKVWLVRLGEVMVYIVAQSVFEQMNSFRDWAIQQLQHGQRAIHRYTNQDNQPEGPVMEVFDSKTGSTTAEPHEVMQGRVQFWQQYWGERSPSEGPPEWLAELEKAAREEEDAGISKQEIVQVIKSAPAAAAKGYDGQIPRQWSTLPSEGLSQLAEILTSVTKQLRWPAQALAVTIVFLGKPTPEGQAPGERPIGLTTGLYRLLCGTRRQLIRTWECESAGHWDTAIRGNSSLRVALCRELDHEISQLNGIASSSVYFDLEKFFDTVQLEQMTKAARGLKYPARELLLSVQMHRAARQLKAGSHHSEWILTARSILAGCGRSISFTRAALYQILQHIHDGYMPFTRGQVWVDDITLTSRGTTSHVTTHAAQCAADLADRLVAAGFRISGKTTVVGGTKAIRDQLHSNIADLGHHFKKDVTARDLGIDASCGSKRRLPVQRARLGKVKLRIRRLKQVVRVAKEAGRLTWVGAEKQASWGHQGLGFSPAKLTGLRSQLLGATGLRRQGGCATTAYQLAAGSLHDPYRSKRLEILLGWLDLAGEHTKSQPKEIALGKAWAKKLPHMMSPHRWMKVVGPMSTVMATLKDISWHPEKPLQWIDPSGDRWRIDLQDPTVAKELSQVIGDSIEGSIWAQAAKHYCGAGAEHGIDFTVIGNRRRRLRKQGRHREVGVLDMVSQGAFWPTDRRRAGGYTTSECCPFCQQKETSAQHLFWSCPKVKEQMGDQWKVSSSLVAVARRAAANCPVMWCRGLVPSDWTFGELLGQLGPGSTFSWGLFDKFKVVPATGLVAATDGSGGSHGGDSRLRRVGWGIVLLTKDGTPVGWKAGGLEDDQRLQSVPRAELRAAVEIARCTSGSLDVWTDCSYVHKGIAEIATRCRHGSSHADLWCELRAEIRGGLSFHKVKAHATEGHFATKETNGLAYVANEMADALANLGAKEHQYPRGAVEQVHAADARAGAVLNHLLAVGGFLAEQGLEKQPKRPVARRKACVVRLLAQATAGTTHHLWKRGSQIGCKLCGQANARMAALRWLGQPCPRAGQAHSKSLAVHSSHRRGDFHGVQVCWKCGAWGVNKAVKLGKPCPGRPTSGHGEYALKAFSRGIRPPKLGRWPDGSLDSQVAVCGAVAAGQPARAKAKPRPRPRHRHGAAA